MIWVLSFLIVTAQAVPAQTPSGDREDSQFHYGAPRPPRGPEPVLVPDAEASPLDDDGASPIILPPPPAIRDLARMTFASGACRGVGFSTSDAAVAAHATAYLEAAVARGLVPRQAMIPVVEEGERYERQFRALAQAMTATSNADGSAREAFVTATSDLCLDAASRWPDVILATPDAPRSRSEVRARLLDGVWHP